MADCVQSNQTAITINIVADRGHAEPGGDRRMRERLAQNGPDWTAFFVTAVAEAELMLRGRTSGIRCQQLRCAE
jgi:hypothetical protein